MNTRFAIIAGIVLLGITAFAVLVPVPHPSSVSVVGKTVEIKTAPTPAKTVSADSKAPEFYGENVRSGLFARPLPPEAPAPPQAAAPDATPPIHVDPAPDAYADYVYTGTVTADGQKQALLENPRARGGWYVRSGDAFMGATVAQIDDNAVTLNVHGKMRRIPKSNTYNVVPLNSAAGASSDKVTSDRGNASVSQFTALARQKEQQMAAESLARTLSEGSLQPTGNFQATFSTGDGTNAVVFSLDDSNSSRIASP